MSLNQIWNSSSRIEKAALSILSLWLLARLAFSIPVYRHPELAEAAAGWPLLCSALLRRKSLQEETQA